MWANPVVRFVASAVLLAPLFACGCRQKPEEDPVQRQQAHAIAARQEALKFVKKDGQVDWRKRVDAASEALDEAKSESRWGRKEKALEHALEAARLLPPPSKDFEMPSASSNKNGGSESGASAGTPGDGAGTPGDGGGSPGDGGGSPGGGLPADGGGSAGSGGGLPGGDTLASEGGGSVTNDEVQALRESLEALLESLDGKAGRASSNLSFERDPIEIR